MKTFVFEEATFYVGQNQKENDELFKIMPETATWFHLDSESSSHVYCVLGDTTSEKSDNWPKLGHVPKLTKEQIKKGAELVRTWSKKSSKVIYLKKNRLKRIGPGLVELLDDPKYA